MAHEGRFMFLDNPINPVGPENPIQRKEIWQHANSICLDRFRNQLPDWGVDGLGRCAAFSCSSSGVREA